MSNASRITVPFGVAPYAIPHAHGQVKKAASSPLEQYVIDARQISVAIGSAVSRGRAAQNPYWRKPPSTAMHSPVT